MSNNHVNRAIALSVLCSIVATYLVTTVWQRKNSDSIKHNGIEELIGNTPIIKVKSLSKATGCEIYAKMELQNPGGSSKDRVALAILQDAEGKGLIKPNCGDMVFEGTSGSTGISLAMLCKAKGYEAHIVLPDDTSSEKIDMLSNLGAVIHKVKPASIVDQKQYTNYARTIAKDINDQEEKNNNNNNNNNTKGRRALFTDQFENEANWNAHYCHTGPEIYTQTGGKLDAFVSGSGTGGTISGVSKYLKERLKNVKVILADPPGSGLYNKVKYGVMFDVKEKEGQRFRHQVDTIVEGIGINRVTQNFEVGSDNIDDAIRVSDDQSLKMAKYVLDHDGLFIGSSSAVNLVAAYVYAKRIGQGHTIVTMVSDSGTRHLSKFWKQCPKDSVELDDI
jgi:cysteine synthase A